MKATLPVSVIKDALKRILFALPGNTVLPILTHILLSAEGGQLHMRTTCLDISAWVKVQAEVEEEGAIAVPGKTFTDLVGSLTSEVVTLSLKKDVLTIAGTGKTNLKCLPAAEFPPAFKLEGDPVIVLSSGEWKKAVAQTVFAVSKDEGRPTLQGINFEGLVSDDTLTLAATDGFRLAIRQIEVPVKKGFSVIIPGAALKKTPFKDEVEPVGFYIVPGRGVAFVGQDWGMSASAIEGNFPDWRKILPEAFKTSTRLVALPMLNAIKQGEVFARDAGHVIRLGNRDGRLLVTGKSDTGVSERLIEEVEFTETIAANGVFLTQALESLGTETVRFQINQHNQPMLFTAEGSLDAKVLIMPLYIGDDKMDAAAAAAADAATTTEE